MFWWMQSGRDLEREARSKGWHHPEVPRPSHGTHLPALSWSFDLAALPHSGSLIFEEAASTLESNRDC